MGNPFNMFKRPKINVPEPPATPTVDEARQNQDITDRMRKKRGRAAAQLTSPVGDPTVPQTAAKTLLGQ